MEAYVECRGLGGTMNRCKIEARVQDNDSNGG